MMQIMALNVNFSLILECNINGTIDLSCNWITGGRTQHVDTHLYMLQDCNRGKIIQMKWIKDEDNSADPGTNTINYASHAKHSYIG